MNLFGVLQTCSGMYWFVCRSTKDRLNLAGTRAWESSCGANGTSVVAKGHWKHHSFRRCSR